MLTQEYLKSILHYDPVTGVFTWSAPRPRCVVGAVAGCANKATTHRYIKINGKSCLAGRLAWLYVHGHYPSEMIDHIDRDPSNNRLSNLREATRGQNCQNAPLRKDSTSGYRGVSLSKSKGLWVAQISCNAKNRVIGTFNCPKLAHEAYCKAAKELHGDFANFG